MKKIGVLFGVENSFPSALVEEINARNGSDVEAEFATVGASLMNSAQPYAVLIDRISHELPFYRSYLKHAALNGVTVLNNPFWSSADDKFINYSLAEKLGVAAPETVLLPHKSAPKGSTARSLRNLEFPLDWESVFRYAGEHGFLKPIDGGGWRDAYEVRGREEFFRAYDQSKSLCMVYQRAIEYTQCFRCYVVGAKAVRIMPYDPRRPHAERYLTEASPCDGDLLTRMESDAVRICRALGYEMNSIEFAVENGVPYAIDFLNPVPDGDYHSVGKANFEWFVRAVADLAIDQAKPSPKSPKLAGAVSLCSRRRKRRRAPRRAGRPSARREKSGAKAKSE